MFSYLAPATIDNESLDGPLGFGERFNTFGCAAPIFLFFNRVI